MPPQSWGASPEEVAPILCEAPRAMSDRVGREASARERLTFACGRLAASRYRLPPSPSRFRWRPRADAMTFGRPRSRLHCFARRDGWGVHDEGHRRVGLVRPGRIAARPSTASSCRVFGVAQVSERIDVPSARPEVLGHVQLLEGGGRRSNQRPEGRLLVSQRVWRRHRPRDLVCKRHTVCTACTHACRSRALNQPGRRSAGTRVSRLSCTLLFPGTRRTGLSRWPPGFWVRNQFRSVQVQVGEDPTGASQSSSAYVP